MEKNVTKNNEILTTNQKPNFEICDNESQLLVFNNTHPDVSKNIQLEVPTNNKAIVPKKSKKGKKKSPIVPANTQTIPPENIIPVVSTNTQPIPPENIIPIVSSNTQPEVPINIITIVPTNTQPTSPKNNQQIVSINIQPILTENTYPVLPLNFTEVPNNHSEIHENSQPIVPANTQPIVPENTQPKISENTASDVHKNTQPVLPQNIPPDVSDNTEEIPKNIAPVLQQNILPHISDITKPVLPENSYFDVSENTRSVLPQNTHADISDSSQLVITENMQSYIVDHNAPVIPDNTQQVMSDNTTPEIINNTINKTHPIISNINLTPNNNIIEEKYKNLVAQEKLNYDFITEIDINKNKLDKQNLYNSNLGNACYFLNKCEDSLKVKFDPLTYEFYDEILHNTISSSILIDEIKERIDKVKEKKENLVKIELIKRISILEGENERLKQDLNNENEFQVLSYSQINIFNEYFFS